MKALDLSLVFPTASELRQNSPEEICKFFNFSDGNKRVCVHKKSNGYHLMCWNYQPSYFKGFAPYNEWFSVSHCNSVDYACHLFRLAVVDMLKDIVEKTIRERRLTLDSIIEQLVLYRSLCEGEK